MFYVLKKTHRGDVRGDTEFLEEEPWNQADPPKCPACGAYIGKMIWLPPYRVELECWDREFGDLALVAGENMLVSERFKRLYERWGLTGLHGLEPVKVERIKRHKRFSDDPPQYYRAWVKRTGTAIDQQRSGFVWAEPQKVCPVCQWGGGIRRWKRIVIEERTWTGEDIFIARGMSTFIASARFKEFCESEKITNAVLVPANEYRVDLAPQDNDEKAREILTSPLGPTLLEKIKPDGEVWRFDTVDNYMVIAGPDGAIRRIFRPFKGEGMEFWQRQ